MKFGVEFITIQLVEKAYYNKTDKEGFLQYILYITMKFGVEFITIQLVEKGYCSKADRGLIDI
jgi:hypothetical protein